MNSKQVFYFFDEIFHFLHNEFIEHSENNKGGIRQW